NTLLQMIDPLTLKWGKKFSVPGSVYDLSLSDTGAAFFTEGRGEWTDIKVVDLKKGEVAGGWGGVWVRSFLALSPDGRRIYHSSQGVSPGTLDALVVPARLNADRAVSYRAPSHDKLALGGDIVISPDGRFLLCKTGTILKLFNEKESDLTSFGKIEPFLAAAFDIEGRLAYTLARDGTLRRYSYP